MTKFALIGKNIEDSLSPSIYKVFFEYYNKKSDYLCISCSKKNFFYYIKKFFLNDGFGMNITSPFKNISYSICDFHTERSIKCRSVNVIKKINGFLIGDNTDGIGLLQDLVKIGFLKKNYKILILGSGGVIKSIVLSLMSFKSIKIFLHARNARKIKEIQNFFGNRNIQIADTCKKNQIYNLIIQATSIVSYREIQNLTKFVKISKNTLFYDLNYSNKKTTYSSYYKKKVKKYTNGIGMLFYQAAHAFFFWNGIFPNIEILKKILYKHK
ncbi:hypothetical protein [bacterium endosymbiont of Pedicinus badii]|uniref:hypothetical protein n=1 Tax=bacterium endosymbiont of Pedicinus badii TaxID=1719126 RepID=UPI0009BBC5BE|nr:hypothetical protein [bacterium endosymbiont of Pedicinus badii]OQM34129.1 hypothetical protein AOQ89_02180 [bacterium endosymbiont of Pedicinus badii]